MENITPKFSLTCLKCEVASLSLSCLLSLASGEAPVGMVALSCLQGLGKSSGPEFLLPQNLKNSEFLPHSCSQHPSDQRWAQFPVLPLSPPPSLPPFLPITPLSSHHSLHLSPHFPVTSPSHPLFPPLSPHPHGSSLSSYPRLCSSGISGWLSFLVRKEPAAPVSSTERDTPPPGLCARFDFSSLIMMSFNCFSIYPECGSLGFFYSLE